MSSSSPIQVVRSNRRSLALSVLPNGTIVAKVPFFAPMFVVNQFINNHEEWIEKQREKLQKKNFQIPKKRQFTDGEKILFLGNEYEVTLGNCTAISLQKDAFLFPQVLLFRAEKELTQWYITQAREIITKQVQNLSEEMMVSYNAISFSDTSSKWGSCSHENKLQFNWRLIMAPLLVMRYVVVHELSHTIHKNHSASFWSKVRFYNPSYNQQRKWLREHGHLLMV